MSDRDFTDRIRALEARELAETSPEALKAFDAALSDFKRATAELNIAWERVPGWIVDGTYPSWTVNVDTGIAVDPITVSLPSFDEFALMVGGMEFKRLPEPELPRHDAPPIGARVIVKPGGWPDYSFANVGAEQLGTVREATEDTIEVQMDRFYPGLRDWHNCLQCSAVELAQEDERYVDLLSPAEAAAVIFHRHFTVIA